LLFAAMHIRTAAENVDVAVVVFVLGVYSVASLLMIALAALWLRFAAGATLADFGIVPSKLAGDVRIGLVAFLAVTAPIYAIMFDANQWLPENCVADPIPILFLALALGTLYYRTHRIIPSLALHMAFNSVAVFMSLAQSK
jgi:hypothetical protein